MRMGNEVERLFTYSEESGEFSGMGLWNSWLQGTTIQSQKYRRGSARVKGSEEALESYWTKRLTLGCGVHGWISGYA